jgi:hypothetical protein
VVSSLNTTAFASGTPDYTVPPAASNAANLRYRWQIGTDNGTSYADLNIGGVYSG